MNTLLRKWAEWKTRRSAAQLIVLDGATEMERSRAFWKGGVLGVLTTLLVVVLAGPSNANSELLDRLQEREAMLQEQNQRMAQAAEVADVCLSTARNLEQILTTYHGFLDVNAPRANPVE